MPSTLDGITILDLSTGGAAALATMLLSDQGARVIRVAAPDAPAFRDGGFVIWDRGKERLSLDLDEAMGETAAAARFRELVGGADVLVEDFAPSADRQRLGITLTQPLVSQAQVPIAYPSLVRQPVRNDYPWLLLREVGAGLVRVPCEDLGDSTQQSRLQWLRQDGLQLQAVAVGLGAAAQTAVAHADAFDRLEVQLTDGPVPNAQQLQQLGELDSPLALCAIVPGDHIAGKQHPRTRVGYRANELVQLLPIVSECGPDVAMVMCAEVQQALTPAALIAPAELPLQLRLSLDDEATAPTWITRALIQAAAWQAPLFVEPLIDLDRTMDGASGLLDPLCNPRRAFETARVLTALLEHVRPERFEVGPVQERIQMSGASAHLTVWPSGAVDETSAGRWFDLSSGSVSQRQMPVEGRGPVALLQ